LPIAWGRRFAACAALLVASHAAAAETLEVAVDKGYLLKLERDADIVLIAEPAIANAVVESPRLIFVLGKRSGVTNLFVLDRDGNVIRESDVVVLANDAERLTIHRGAKATTMSCLPNCIDARGRQPAPATGAQSGPAGAPPSS
jgi:Flp pilus assembly secretin CpaC